MLGCEYVFLCALKDEEKQYKESYENFLSTNQNVELKLALNKAQKTMGKKLLIKINIFHSYEENLC